jgi:hypothetical protein
MSSGPATAIRSAYRRLSGHRNSAETRIATRTGACHYTNRLNDRSRFAPSQCPVRLRASPLVCDCAVKRLPGMAREVRLHLPDHVIDLGETLLLVGGPRPRGRSCFRGYRRRVETGSGHGRREGRLWQLWVAPVRPVRSCCTESVRIVWVRSSCHYGHAGEPRQSDLRRECSVQWRSGPASSINGSIPTVR